MVSYHGRYWYDHLGKIDSAHVTRIIASTGFSYFEIGSVVRKRHLYLRMRTVMVLSSP